MTANDRLADPDELADKMSNGQSGGNTFGLLGGHMTLQFTGPQSGGPRTAHLLPAQVQYSWRASTGSLPGRIRYPLLDCRGSLAPGNCGTIPRRLWAITKRKWAIFGLEYAGFWVFPLGQLLFSAILNR